MENILEVRNLHKSFAGIHAVSDVSFELRKGEILGLIGPNGSGKSTCVNLISGVYIADSGDVIFDGKSILKKSIPERARLGVGRTFQSPKPFIGLSVFDSVYTIAMQHRSFHDAKVKAQEVLELTGLWANRDMPCEKLPIEKRKWLDMARVLTNDPKVLLLDEVLAGLNPSEIDASVELIRRINDTGVAILFIEHVIRAVVNLCERIVVLNDGKLLTQGMPEAVMKDPEVVKAYLGGGYHGA